MNAARHDWWAFFVAERGATGISSAGNREFAHVQDWFAGLLFVALGSAVGGPARYFVSGLVGRTIGETFPWGTMTVNVVGAFAIGAIAAAASLGKFSAEGAWPFAVTGFLGSFTTVSSFSLQTLALARDGETWRAGANVVLSVVLSLGAVAIGFWVTRTISGGAA